MQVGMTKDHGLYNKPSATVHPGALAVGTLPQYNIIVSVLLTCSWLKLIYTPLFTLCVIICIQTSIVNIFDAEISSLVNVWKIQN